MKEITWRDPTLEEGVDPIPAPETHPLWVQLTMDYFSKSSFYDSRSLTAIFRARGTSDGEMAETIASTPGTYYTVFSEGRIPVVVKTENIISKDSKRMESRDVEYYIIVKGVVSKLPSLRDESLKQVGRVAAICTAISLRAGRESLKKLLPDCESPPASLKRLKVHSAGTYVDGVVGAFKQFENEVTEMQRRRQQEEEAAIIRERELNEKQKSLEVDGFTKVQSSLPPIVFTDPRTSKQLQFTATVNTLNYTVDGDPRDPVGVIQWIPEKSLLKFPETKKGAKLPATGWQKIIEKLRHMCEVYKIKHNIPVSG